ncbi:MAG: hypothetical protein DCC65_03375 [Planctomycetota bacterium]|nr:MAG: hypothetical protein DCC65_03375 [Planctomycetota bacterium]
MNEKPKLDQPFEPGVSPRRHDGSLFDRNESATDDLEAFLAESAAELSLPRLTLRHPEDFEDDTDIEARADTEHARPSASQSTPDDAEDTWPWNTDLFGSKPTTSDIEDADPLDFETPATETVISARPAETAPPAHTEDDHSAIEDVLLSMPLVQTPIQDTLDAFARTDESEAASEPVAIEPSPLSDAEPATCEVSENSQPVTAVVIAASEKSSTPTAESSEVAAGLAAEAATAGSVRPPHTPKRIGSGQLVPARLTWKPGDPFGDSDGRGRRRFRWDVMLTSAGITAACGMFCIWVLRTLLA